MIFFSVLNLSHCHLFLYQLHYSSKTILYVIRWNSPFTDKWSTPPVAELDSRKSYIECKSTAARALRKKIQLLFQSCLVRVKCINALWITLGMLHHNHPEYKINADGNFFLTIFLRKVIQVCVCWLFSVQIEYCVRRRWK